MGSEVIVFTLILMIVGPIVGLVLGGFCRGKRWATVVVYLISLLATEPIVIRLIREFSLKDVPISFFICATNIALILIPFYFFKKMFAVSDAKNTKDL